MQTLISPSRRALVQIFDNISRALERVVRNGTLASAQSSVDCLRVTAVDEGNGKQKGWKRRGQIFSARHFLRTHDPADAPWKLALEKQKNCREPRTPSSIADEGNIPQIFVVQLNLSRQLCDAHVNSTISPFSKRSFLLNWSLFKMVLLTKETKGPVDIIGWQQLSGKNTNFHYKFSQHLVVYFLHLLAYIFLSDCIIASYWS